MPQFMISICQANRKGDNDYVLIGSSQFMEPRLCLKKYKLILRSLGIEEYDFHTLRHTFATRCVENGFDMKSLSEILGHSNINTTLQRYVHPSLELKQMQMNRLENISVLGQNKGQKNELC